MAEFCLDCWNKLNQTSYTEREYILGKDIDLCEGCGEKKRVIEAKRKIRLFYDLKEFLSKP